MAVERTLSIIKPDAVGKNIVGKIYSRFESNGLRIVAAKMLHLSDEVAGGFYAEHRKRPFFPDLISFMTSGPVVVQVLEGEDELPRQPSPPLDPYTPEPGPSPGDRRAFRVIRLSWIPIAILVERLGRVADHRMRQICAALAIAVDCSD